MKRYDSYKDSGVEWIGEIPEGWEVKRLKYVAKICTEKAEEGAEKVALENIESKTGRYITTDTAFEGEGIRFNQGNILYGKLRPYLAKVWVADFDGAAVGDFFVITTEHHFSSTYLKYRLLSEEFTDLANGSTFGSKMPRVDKEFLTDLPFAVPSLPEQTAIASFLDRKTTEIDQLIANKEKLIALYEEEKTAIINRAVTRGLDPQVTLKPSGVDWLGDIPEYWEVKRLKYFVSKVGSGVTPKGGASVYQLDGIPLLRSQNVHFSGLKMDDVAYITQETHDDMGNSKVMSGDVLLNITGASIGRCYFTDDALGEANVNQHVCIIRPTSSITTMFLYYLLRSDVGQKQIDIEQTGSGREGLNFESLKNFVLIVPEYTEQASIVTHIETECSRLDTIIDKFKLQIELFKEYRTTLISEVVTGKIDVRDEVAA